MSRSKDVIAPGRALVIRPLPMTLPGVLTALSLTLLPALRPAEPPASPPRRIGRRPRLPCLNRGGAPGRRRVLRPVGRGCFLRCLLRPAASGSGGGRVAGGAAGVAGVTDLTGPPDPVPPPLDVRGTGGGVPAGRLRAGHEMTIFPARWRRRPLRRSALNLRADRDRQLAPAGRASFLRSGFFRCPVLACQCDGPDPHQEQHPGRVGRERDPRSEEEIEDGLTDGWG